MWGKENRIVARRYEISVLAKSIKCLTRVPCATNAIISLSFAPAVALLSHTNTHSRTPKVSPIKGFIEKPSMTIANIGGVTHSMVCEILYFVLK